MIPTVQQGLRQDGQNWNEENSLKVAMKNLGENFGLKCSNLFAGLSLEAEGGSSSLRLSIATAVVGSALQMQRQCPADPQAYPIHS